MNIVASFKAFMTSTAGRATSLSVVALVGVAAAGFLLFHDVSSLEGSGAIGFASHEDAKTTQILRTESLAAGTSEPVVVGKGKADAFGLETVPVRRSSWPERLRVTGRLELNASRVAHVSSLVEGVIREVPVELGQTVKKGDILAFIDSREVGVAKLQLVKDKLQLASAKRACEWHTTIHKNTCDLLDALREGQALDEVETAFRDRPVGAYREQLVSAMARLNRTSADFKRVRELGADSIIPEKEVIRARAEHEAATATYGALKEQIRFEARQRALDAQQELQATEAAVAISRSHLLILGYDETDIDSMDPIAEAERVAYYPIRSPIDGTIIAKNAPLSQHVDDETELIEIADLSTVWLRADIFEKDLGAIRGLQGKTVTFETSSYPGQQFTAETFSTGDIVDDETRAARLLATASNSDRLLKPGMFVEIELTPRKDADVLQLPAAALQRHAGATFVFIADGSDGFERRDVELGRSTSQLVEINAGLREGERAVVNGGFALKSEMLSELMVEE
jgi:cobalt-zinc-cadmium efflux system membrane fusion protein